MSQIFKPKFFSLLKLGISRSQVQADVLSGVVVGIVALPLAIAFAVASGVSPEKGLITAVIAGFIISLLGGSRVQIGGPTGAFIVIVYGIVEQYGLSGLMISTVMAGLILILLGVLRLGSLLKYFPRPLVVGFTSGIALVIFSTQIRDAFGLDIDKVPSDFVEKWMVFAHRMGSVNYYALGVTAFTILIVVFTKRFTARIPGSFIAIIAGTAVVQLFQFPVSTIASFFGEIPVGFGFELPDVQFMELGRYIQPALTIAILGGVESLLSAVVSDGMISGNHRSNTELIAQGIANVVTPFFGGIPATGAIARTATNVKNGGRTPIAGMVHALTLLLIMVFGVYLEILPPFGRGETVTISPAFDSCLATSQGKVFPFRFVASALFLGEFRGDSTGHESGLCRRGLDSPAPRASGRWHMGFHRPPVSGIRKIQSGQRSIIWHYFSFYQLPVIAIVVPNASPVIYRPDII